ARAESSAWSARAEGTEWWAFGHPLPNAAVVSAARQRRDSGEVVHLEVASFGASPERLTVTLKPEVTAFSAPATLNLAPIVEHVPVAPGRPARIFEYLPPGVPALRVSLPPDELQLDGEPLLLPSSARRVRVDLRFSAGALREEVERALNAASRATPATGEADL